MTAALVGLVTVLLGTTGCVTGQAHRDDKRTWTTADGGIHNRSSSLTVANPVTGTLDVIGGLFGALAGTVEINVNNQGCYGGRGAYVDYGNNQQWCPVGQHIENFNGQRYFVQNGYHAAIRDGGVVAIRDAGRQGPQTLYGH